MIAVLIAITSLSQFRSSQHATILKFAESEGRQSSPDNNKEDKCCAVWAVFVLMIISDKDLFLCFTFIYVADCPHCTISLPRADGYLQRQLRHARTKAAAGRLYSD